MQPLKQAWLLLAISVLLSACSPASPTPYADPPQPDQGSIIVGHTADGLEYVHSGKATFEAGLGQFFAIQRNQTVEIPAENLSILHTTIIEFECPEEHDCEVPLIAFDYFEVFQDGRSLGQQKWGWEMTFGDYKLITEEIWQSYDYENHQFEIIMTAVRR